MKTIYHGSDHIVKKPIFNFECADENTVYGNDRFSNFLAEQDYKNGHTIIDLMRQNDINK